MHITKKQYKKSQESVIKTYHKKKKTRLRNAKEKKNQEECIKRMSEKTLKFNNIMVNKKEFHKSKQPIDLMSVNVDQIVLSDKFKDSDKGFKYLIG